MKRITWAILIKAAVVLAAGYGSPRDFTGWNAALNADHVFCGKGPGVLPQPSRVTRNYDVLKYIIAADVDDAAKKITATTTVRVKSEEANLTQLSFDFTNQLTVTRVTCRGTPATFNHSGNVLTVTVNPPASYGEVLAVGIEYNGTPGYGFFFTTAGFYTSTEMSYSRNWFPCYDAPDDKADEGCELVISCREDWFVGANGLLVGARKIDDGRAQYHWVENYAIATYLIAITAANYYRGFNQIWRGMPVNYFIYQNQANAAPIFFEHQPDMLDCFSDKFCEYPFKNEKYGVAGVTNFLWGGMENQTLTHIKDSYITPNHSGDHLLAHELAHSWWGDMVTCRTWADLWLNEGFATYGDALYTEYAEGTQKFRERMEYYAYLYFQEDEEHRFPIYNPAEPWSATVYEKGAWVLHMLRRLLGDQKFYQAINAYGDRYKYKSAITDELCAVFEESYGDELDWFFDQWVYKAGYPEFEYYWSVAADNTITITIEQVQEETPLTPLFRCLVDLTITCYGGKEYKEEVWVSGRKHTFQFNYPETPNWVYFDKDVWLLDKTTVTNDVALQYFRAEPSPDKGGVLLSWATAPGKNFAGFNLFREDAAPGVVACGRAKINGVLIKGRSPYSFVDDDVRPGGSYQYWLIAVDTRGREHTFGPRRVELPAARPAFALYQNHPNPAPRGRTTFGFTLETAGPASLTVYDLSGREVWRHAGHFAAGEHKLSATLPLPAGVYLYRLETAGAKATKRLVITD